MAMSLGQQPGHDPLPRRHSPREGYLWSRWHFLIRVLGLTGILAFCVGLVLASLDHLLDSWQPVQDAVVAAFTGDLAPPSAYLLGIGGLVALVALVVEIVQIVFYTAGRRSALGANAILQVVLATLLLIAVNILSAGIDLNLFGKKIDVPAHYTQIDLTRGQLFTLPAKIREDFHKLQSETTVVILQRHKPGALTDKVDRYDAAAERKVVEKVKDLVAQLREIGPRFRVEVLDTEAEGYDDKLKKLTEQAPELRQAIESAPENSLFFSAGGRVQQLSFNDFFRLDKTASREEGRDNLVLIQGGVEPVAGRILNLEQRKPRVGILVVHEALTTEGIIDFYTLAGLRKSLTEHGFEVRDVVLKKGWDAPGELEPAADALEDSKLERLQDEQQTLDARLALLDRQVKTLEELVKVWPVDSKTSLKELNQQLALYIRRFEPQLLGLQLLDEEDRKDAEPIIKEKLTFFRRIQKDRQQEKDEVVRELSTLNADRVGENRRMGDVRAKLERTLLDCDLLILPRLTILDEGMPVAGQPIYDLDPRQALVIKDYLAAGKPLLACLGPTNRPGQPPDPPDELEKLLAQLGLHFGKRTVLYNAEERAFTATRANRFRASKPIQMPPLDLEKPPVKREEQDILNRIRQKLGSLAILSGLTAGPLQLLPFLAPRPAPEIDRPANKLRASLRLAGHCAGKDLNLSLRFARPVYLDSAVSGKQKDEPAVLVTSEASWNDDQPFPTTTRPVPRFEPPPPNDPDNKTAEERRVGPFVVGLAYEAEVPRSWLPSESVTPPHVRLGAIGHGGVFVGKELTPAREKLLLDTCNWLLGRDDRLANPEAPQWRYPRVDMNGRTEAIWLWATGLGMPLLFAYLGLVVLLARRLR